MKVTSVSLLLLAFLNLSAGQEPTCDHHEQYDTVKVVDNAEKSEALSPKPKHRRLLLEKESCPSADICRQFWWDIFGLFTRYTLRELDGCASKCTSLLNIFLNNGWVCENEGGGICKGRVLFDKGGLEDAVSFMDTSNGDNHDSVRGRVLIEDLVKDLKGNIEGTFKFKENIFLFPEKMDEVIQFIDKTLEDTLARGVDTIIKRVPIKNDFQFDITTETLKTLIGIENVRALYKFYQEYDPGFPVSRITLRRVDFQDSEMHLDWHVDGEGNIVTHVFLNEVMEGGSYTFVGPDGMEEVAAHKGTALVHGQNVIHGIESFKGRRYTLLFVGDNRDAKDIVAALIEKEEIMALKTSY